MRQLGLLTLTVALLSACGSLNTAQPEEAADVPAASQDASAVTIQAAVSKNKLGSSLNVLAATPAAQRLSAQALPQQARRSPFAIQDGAVTIDAIAEGDPQALLSRLQALGLQGGAVYGATVSGRLPVSALRDAAQLPELRFARQALARRSAADVSAQSHAAYPVTGLTVSQGVKAMRADVAVHQFDVRGRGIDIGVLSDTYNNYDTSTYGTPLTTAQDDIRNNDLPRQGVRVIEEGFDKGSDEGRGMLQIVHDVAPGADKLFASAFNGEASFARNIVRLANAGSDVIVDDVLYYAEPMFQDGIVAQAVDEVARRGISYFSSAGNAARQSYESPFFGSTRRFQGGELHDFKPGNATDTLQKFTVPAKGDLFVVLQWDEPFASATRGGKGSRSDLDLYVLDAAGRLIPPDEERGQFTVSADKNIDADPVEIVQYINYSDKPVNVNLTITKYAGSSPSRVKYVNFGNAVPQEYDTQSGTSYGHANARGAAGVGAVRYSRTPEFGQTPPLLETFSSRGGVPILRDLNGNRINEVRKQPRFSAPDGVNTSFFGQVTFSNGNPIDGDEFPNFFGTSAAAPHAAGVAALMLEKRRDLSPQAVYDALSRTAIDMNQKGFDFDSGAGFVQADKAVDAVLDRR